MLDNHDVPLPEMLKRRRSKAKKTAHGLPSSGGHPGSILQELLIVENIEEPAITCRRGAILGANQAFANLIGHSQADLLGLETSEVIDRSSHKLLMDFAQQLEGNPGKKSFQWKANLKTDEMPKMRAMVMASPLRQIADALLLVIKRPE
jgi:PAS domain-containing protein